MSVASTKPERSASDPTAEGARLGHLEIKVGVLPLAAIAGLPTRIGVRVPAEVVLPGYNFTATRRRELGPVNDVFLDAELFAKLDAICTKFA